MITLYQYMPAWTVPCISPYVTKVAYYMKMAGLPFEARPQDLTRLDRDTPAGKLPCIVDSDGTSVNDSTHIIEYLQGKYGEVLDEGATATERAQMHAFNRMIDEHTYWVAVIQPRWRESEGWEKYVRIIAGTEDVPPALRAFADDFRFRILNEFMTGGWGRMPADVIYRRARADVDAMSDFLGSKPFFMGDTPRWVDAPVLSILRHIVDSPFTYDTKAYATSKKNLLAYMDRMQERFGI
ncbi:glutathione S-transferase [Variovorax sp. WS11]|uniref:iIsoprene-epoxide--glutathione S-transferase n=1 Tax=Variovorax sp. WS11 TaxID=1105204 RepID=UPI000D0CE394|nr:glutathione S-transferase C-terminal domain-containing protein [Variovorax sp. WS11]NDZ17411.1 glutathione S-transferase family protein [Variovorax sp. WS11]PSL86054.1 glutathione S-transferase [Variovorax sp. WS11]